MKDPIENALEKMKPADLPAPLMARLTAARPQADAEKPRLSLFRRWLLPLASGACAALATFAILRDTSNPVGPAPHPQQAAHYESDDYLLGARNVGIIVGADRRPYRIVEVEWLERNTVPARASAPGVRVDTTRRGVIPVALDIY